jgi:hypothetical protein
MNKITWTIDDTTAHVYCRSEKAAKALKDRVQSVDGCNVEQDGDFVYVMLNDENGDAAEAELLAAGFDVESI